MSCLPSQSSPRRRHGQEAGSTVSGRTRKALGTSRRAPAASRCLRPLRDLPSSTPESGTRGRGFRPHVRKENRRKLHHRNDVLYHLGPGGKVECF